MTNYILTPKGDLVAASMIGRVRANDTGLLILGKGSDELIEYEQCPRDVAKAWRDALIEYLMQLQQRPGRAVEAPNWRQIAGKVDPTWAKGKGFEPPAASANPARS